MIDPRWATLLITERLFPSRVCAVFLKRTCCVTGTGGTIAGVSAFLKQQQPEIQVYLIDPPGSSLYNKVRDQTQIAG